MEMRHTKLTNTSAIKILRCLNVSERLDNIYAYSEAGDLKEKTTPQDATHYAYDSLDSLHP